MGELGSEFKRPLLLCKWPGRLALYQAGESPPAEREPSEVSTPRGPGFGPVGSNGGNMKHLAVLAALLASPAAAQSFNIDVGMNLGPIAGLPDANYGAAAMQPGTWNAVMPSTAPSALVTLSGASLGATVRSDATSTFNVFPGVMPTGDDQKLMEDFHLTPNLNVASTWTFEGLTNAQYTVYTYASDPSLPALRTEIAVTGSTDPAQLVGAGWPGSHALGQTFTMHSVMVTDGTLTVVANAVGGQLETGVLNGFQLVIRDLVGIGMPYCMANVNSTGVAAEINATGSTDVAQNDVLLTCAQMPNFSFGFFLTSQMQGFVMNPGGSNGNLCLAGSIGRYIGPGQVQNSLAFGQISLALDLTQHPTPAGLVAVMPGETWNFSTWFREGGPVGPSSNFSNGYEILFQ